MNNRAYIQDHLGHPHYLSDQKIKTLKTELAFSDQEQELVRIIKNLSDPTKLKIYLLFHQIEEIAVTDITLILDLSQSAVSHALSDLKNLGLIECHRCGQLICYRLCQHKKQSQIQTIVNNLFGRFR